MLIQLLSDEVMSMIEGAGMADCPADGQSEVQMLLVHDAEAVYTPVPERRKRNLLLAGWTPDPAPGYDNCLSPRSGCALADHTCMSFGKCGMALQALTLWCNETVELSACKHVAVRGCLSTYAPDRMQAAVLSAC
jgi:hypothetical protein